MSLAFTTPVLSASREDGYGDAWGNVFQGVRVYDPTMAQWTAPDAYAGDVHDPMSQKPFMWNNNNPLDFGDPTGYDPTVTETTAADGQKTVNIDYKFTFSTDDGVTNADKKTFLNNLNFTETVGDTIVKVTAVEAYPDEAGSVGTTLVHLENSNDYKDNKAGAPANGGPGHGTTTRGEDGKVWDVRVGTMYNDARNTQYAQRHEALHNAGANHHLDNPGDIMAGYNSRSYHISSDDLSDILSHYGLSH